MMNDLKIFECEEFGSVRTLDDGKEILCKGALKRGILTNGGWQDMIF